ncbi:MAG: proline--tRNA ligase [Acidobacteria bacterium]|nr:proline--tRNA ligase [Acidobacteriota bacterium]
MRRSRYLLNTLKETPKEAVVVSHQLMLRTGMIKQLASGIYTYMPFGLRAIRKVERIVREELDRAGCIELLMPSVQPAELWEESGRWKDYGKELLRIYDRKDNAFCYGPTHEEVVTDVVRREVRSYKELPLNLYQIQTKFRDEMRPRFGLMRGREFIMKDAYSFDVDDTACDASYWLMFDAYKRIFERCGLEFRPVEADSGAIGGSFTHEFHVLASSGEDQILSCNHCDYAANVERCEVVEPSPSSPETANEPIKVATPGQKTIEQVAEFLGVTAKDCVKTLLVKRDSDMLVLALRGDRTLNEAAVKAAFNLPVLEMVGEDEARALGLVPGYLAPMGLDPSLKVVVDPEVLAMTEAVVGANEEDRHVKGVCPAVHFDAHQVMTLREAEAGETCPRCREGILESWRGIEVGQVFKLGLKYSTSLGATYLDDQGKSQPMVMGCYGIGITRTVAAAIEQNHDENGIIWPAQIAPFHVALLNLDPEDEQVSAAADSIYSALGKRGVEVLHDDSTERPGFKFKDADLLGFPIQVVLGKRSLNQGLVDLKMRRTNEKRSIALAECVDAAVDALRELGWE